MKHTLAKQDVLLKSTRKSDVVLKAPRPDGRHLLGQCFPMGHGAVSRRVWVPHQKDLISNQKLAIHKEANEKEIPFLVQEK